ncbi:MAG: sigma-70 family RNA polymerase sigma factor [Armatimonadetes bacterium]|nr:sigma-70 family RNA polymerase sigma factor [Armatimonadota bacterium]
MDKLETMWEASKEYLRRMLISMVRDIDLAEDILQETYLSASNGLSGYRGDNAQAWLSTIARRCAFAHLRKAYTKAETPLPPDEECAVDCPMGSYTHLETMLVRKALQDLSPVLRETLLLKHYGGMNYPEIAAHLGCPVGTAKRRVWTAIRQLRSMLNLTTKEMRKMTCPDTRLLDYTYGILSGRDREKLEEHLRSCESCRILVDDARRVMADLDSVRDYESYTDITEIHTDGTSTTYSCRRVDNKSSEPITKTEWCSMDYHTLKNVFVGGEEIPFEIAKSDVPNERHYIARLPKPLAPGGSIVSFVVFTTPPGIGAAFDIGYGRWVAVPDNSGTDSADHMLVQMVVLPEGARLIGAIPEPQETRTGSRSTLVWKRVIPSGGEARERPVVVYML